WTGTNFLSLVETLLERRARRRGTGDGDVIEDIPQALDRSGDVKGTPGIPAAWLTAYAFAVAALPVAWGFAVRRHVEAMHSGASPYYFSFSWVELLLAGLLIVAAALGVKRALARRASGGRAGVWRIAGIVLCVGLAAFILYGWAASLKLRTVSGKLFIWSTLICALGGILGWFTAAGGLTGGLCRLFRKEADRSGAMLYWPTAFAIAGLLVFFAPMALYQSAPETFTRSAAAMARELLPYFLCVIYGFLYLRVALSRRGSALLGLFLAYLALVGIVLAWVFPPAGILEGDAFLPDARGAEWVGMAQDVAGLAAALALLFILARRTAMRYAAWGLGVSAAAMIAFGAYVSVSMAGGKNGSAAAAGIAVAAEKNIGGETELPPFHKRLFSLSPDRPNVLVLLYDQYHGGDVGRMLDEDPAMAARLPGFVWYRDVVSDGNNTLMSFPALLGGPGYTPEAINRRSGRPLADRVVDAVAELPRRFLNAGYAVSSYNVESNLSIDSGKSLSDLLGYAGDRLVDTPRRPEYFRLAQEALASGGGGDGAGGGDAKLLLAVSLFRSVPNGLRAGLIDAGIFETDSSGKIYDDAAIPLLMPRFLTADSEEPTYKIFVSALSHNPFLLGPDSMVPLENEERRALSKSGDAHFYTDRHIIRMLETLAARLKAMGVYGNTRIILASDHDYQRDSNPFMSGMTHPFAQLPPRPYALLLVKDFNADGPLTVSDRLMQGHDMPALACAGLPEIADAPALPPDDPGRERRHCIGRANLHHHAADSFRSLRILLNTGSMFEPSNWKEAE
ncbi:MAG: hypothetical protein LBS30_01695, partial [Planctomycetota bacterium]|nr:hypothetical protein [Planctomycetota bacterium]